MKTIKPLAIATIASMAIYGCAGSDDMNNTTAMDDSTTISETQTMGGNTTEMDNAETVVVEREVSIPIASIPVATLSLTNPVKVNDMFDDIDDTEQYDLMALAKTSPNLSTFVQLAEAAGITDDLMEDGNYTLFAPTNEAFAKLSKQELEMLLLPENRAMLTETLQAHILPNEYATTQFNSSQRITLSEDRYIPVDTQLNGKQILIGGATIVAPNIEASNGLLHVVDRVIIPSEDAIDGN